MSDRFYGSCFVIFHHSLHQKQNENKSGTSQSFFFFCFVLITEADNCDFETLTITLKTAIAALADALQILNKLVFKFSSA